MAIYFNLITFIINKKIITKEKNIERLNVIALSKEIDPYQPKLNCQLIGIKLFFTIDMLLRLFTRNIMRHRIK